VKNILSRNCIICHQGGNSPGLGNSTTYNGVKPHLDFFYVRVIQDRADMPQGNAPLPKSTRDSLNIWISNCSPEK
jgi:mono/diheme cytochrome c family protein